MDLLKVADIIVEKIKREYPDDVAVMCLCGSHVYGAAHEKSDLDFYYIPKTPRGFELGRSFIIGEIGFDLWALPWEGAESIARYEDRRVAIIADGQIIYYASGEDLEHFKKIQETAQHPEGRHLDRRIKTLLNEFEAAYLAFLEEKSDFSAAKQDAIQLLWLAADTLAAVNRTYIKRGWGRTLAEIESMKDVPGNFRELYEGILFAQNSKELEEKVPALRRALKQTAVKSTVKGSIQEQFSGFYEEMKSTYNKAYHACESGDAAGAALAGASLQTEISDIMGKENTRRAGLPDITGSFNKNDLESYRQLLREHEKQLVRFLEQNGVVIIRYRTVNEFQKSMLP